MKIAPINYNLRFNLPLHGKQVEFLYAMLTDKIDSLRKSVTRSPSATKVSRKNIANQIATLQSLQKHLEDQVRINTPLLIHQHNYGTLTLVQSHPTITRAQLLDMWNANEIFRLEFPDARPSILVHKSDYMLGTEIRFKYRHPPAIFNTRVI